MLMTRSFDAADQRHPREILHRPLTLQQSRAEGLELLPADILGGLKERAQRDQLVEMFVEAVLQREEVARRRRLQFLPDNAGLPFPDDVAGEPRPDEPDQCGRDDRDVRPPPRRSSGLASGRSLPYLG